MLFVNVVTRNSPEFRDLSLIKVGTVGLGWCTKPQEQLVPKSPTTPLRWFEPAQASQQEEFRIFLETSFYFKKKYETDSSAPNAGALTVVHRRASSIHYERMRL